MYLVQNMRFIFLQGQLNMQLKVTPACLRPIAVSAKSLGSSSLHQFGHRTELCTRTVFQMALKY